MRISIGEFLTIRSKESESTPPPQEEEEGRRGMTAQKIGGTLKSFPLLPFFACFFFLPPLLHCHHSSRPPARTARAGGRFHAMPPPLISTRKVMADEERIRQGPPRTHSALSLPGEYVASSICVYETDPLAHEPTAHFRSKKTNVVGEKGEKILAKRGGRRKIAPKGGGGGEEEEGENFSFLPPPLLLPSAKMAPFFLLPSYAVGRPRGTEARVSPRGDWLAKSSPPPSLSPE